MIYSVVTCLIIMASMVVQAGTVDVLVQQVSAERERIQKSEQEKRNILGELYNVNKDLKALNSDRSKIEKGLRSAEENVESLSTLIGQLDKKIGSQRSRLRSRMKALSKFHGQGAARLLFGSRSSAELDANLRTFRIITEKDFRLLRNYQQNLRVFAAQKTKLDTQERRYKSLKQSLDVKQKVLAKQLERKNTVLKAIDSSRILHMAKLKRLRLESSRSVENDTELKKIQVLESLFRPQFFEKKGELVPPVDGDLALAYGLLPESDTKIRFKGNLFRAKEGSPVRAVFSGTVAFTGWLEGYGRTVILDHGDNYFSVYANAASLEVKSGSSVKEGSVLGYTTDFETVFGQGLYFELRHYSEPENPKYWLKGRET